MSEGHVVITGGAGGIGRGIARVFAREGWDITLIDFRADALQDAVADLKANIAAAGRCSFVTADLTSRTEPTDVVSSVWNDSAPIDVLVNGAGIYPSTPLDEMTVEVWDAVLDVNLRAAVLASVAFAKLVKAAGGTGNIVNISSGAALRARYGAAPYTTSKAALEMFTKASALEYGAAGIRVNAVSPGYVAVASPVNPSSDEYRVKVDTNPLGIDGDAEDIGEAVYWITSTKARWVTGTVLRVDGGSSAGNSALPRSWSTMSLGSKGVIGGDEAI